MHIKLRVFTGLFLGLICLSGQAALADCSGGSIPGRLGCQAADAFNGAARKVDDINAGVAAQKAADALAQDRSRAAARVLEQSIGKRNDEIARAAQEAVQKRKQQGLAASSAVNRIELNKDLARREQSSEIGDDIAGGTAPKKFRDADKAAQANGGNSQDWVKKTSNSRSVPDGTKVETHWIENIATGQRTDFKTKSVIDMRPLK